MKNFKRWIIILGAVSLIFKASDLIFDFQEISGILSSAESDAYKAGFIGGKILVFVFGCAAGVYLWQKFQSFKRLKAINHN